MAKSSKKKPSKKKVETNDESSDLNLNFDQVKKHLPIITTIVLVVFVMWFAFFVRSGPIGLDGLDERIEDGLYSQIQNLISQEVRAEYPNINPTYEQELVAERFQKVLDTGVYEFQGQTLDVKAQAQIQAEQYKGNFKAENGQTYLTAIDPYFFLRKASNYQETGTVGDVIIDGVAYEDKQLAPSLKEAGEPNFHIWLEAKLLDFHGVTSESSFGDKMAAVFALSAILAMLSAIPCYFIIRKFSNDLFAFFGSLLMVSVGTYVSRTVAGFVDTDAYNVLFPLLIVAFLIYAFFAKKITTTVVLAGIGGFFMGLFLWTWPAAWFIFFFSVVSLIGYIGFLVVAKMFGKSKQKEFNEKLMNALYTFVSFMIFSVVFSYLLASKNIITTTFKSITGSLSGIAAISSSNVWPNVYSSVAELSNASFNTIVGAVGGEIIFVLSLLGLLLLTLDFKAKDARVKTAKTVLGVFGVIWFLAIISGGLFVDLTQNSSQIFLALLVLPIGLSLLLNLYNNNTDSKIFLSILLTIWVAGTIFMSLNGVRFVLLLAPAFAISFAMSLFYISNGLNKFFAKEFNVSTGKFTKNLFGYIGAAIIFLVLFNPIGGGAIQISKSVTPNFDDSWYDAMQKIDAEAPEDAIITSWWDFGHFFAAVGNRAVTFDGASQTTPQSHWVGKLLLESDEQASHDILRMLTCGGNGAHDTMLEFVDGSAADTVKINKLLYTTFGETKDAKRALIENNKYYTFSSEQVDEIMENLHCEIPRSTYLITSGDMVGKAAVWAHWGSWDFTKKYVRDNYKQLSAEQIAQEVDEEVALIEEYIADLEEISQQAALSNQNEDNLLNRWFADYPGYAGEYNCQAGANETIVCENGVVIDLLAGRILSENIQQGVTFNNLIVPHQSGEVMVLQQEEDGLIDITLIPTGEGRFTGVFSQAPLGDSLFSKMFYLEGYGIEKFKRFHDVQTLTTGRLIIWETIWDQESSLEVESVNFNVSN